MIELTLGWFVFIYLAVFLAGILLLWIGYEMLRKHLSSMAAHQTTLCRICGTTLTNSLTANTTSSLLSCPICGSLNERNHQGGF